ncbi:MAG TPA: efflux transporter outer membrane subunit [Rhizomicrobium sp.]|nr:efflux transporter outer membrane subunit [Rhizomicrobium sp.]
MTTLKMRASLLAAVAAGLAGCTTPVPQALNPSDVPPKFDGPIPSDVGVWPAREWWHGFNSPELDGLIAAAETNNLDIAVAVANVLQAEAQTNIQRSALFPDITLDASAQRGKGAAQRVSTSSGVGVVPGTTQNAFGVVGNTNYTLDIWGLTRDNVRAAEETLRSSRYAQEEVTLTTVSDVGTTYLDALALRERVTIAEENVADAKRVLTITEAKVKNGVSSNLDLAQEQALVAQQESTIPVLKEQEREARLALAILLGQAPEGFDVKAQNLNGIATPLVAPGLPSQLILRRPDVAEAEANLASAHANVDAARAAFFPSVSLTGAGGSQTTLAGDLFHASTLEWSMGASVVQTIFDAGKLFAQSDQAKAQQLGLVATYRKTVISAFSNVETSMGQVSNFAMQQAALERDVKASAEAARISELQYREGIVDLTTVIQTQVSLFTAEDALAQARLAHAQAVIGLYQSLGGGWSQNPEENTQSVTGTTEASAKAPVPNPQDSMWRGIGSIMP